MVQVIRASQGLLKGEIILDYECGAGFKNRMTFICLESSREWKMGESLGESMGCKSPKIPENPPFSLLSNLWCFCSNNNNLWAQNHTQTHTQNTETETSTLVNAGTQTLLHAHFPCHLATFLAINLALRAPSFPHSSRVWMTTSLRAVVRRQALSLEAPELYLWSGGSADKPGPF